MICWLLQVSKVEFHYITFHIPYSILFDYAHAQPRCLLNYILQDMNYVVERILGHKLENIECQVSRRAAQVHSLQIIMYGHCQHSARILDIHGPALKLFNENQWSGPWLRWCSSLVIFSCSAATVNIFSCLKCSAKYASGNANHLTN